MKLEVGTEHEEEDLLLSVMDLSGEAGGVDLEPHLILVHKYLSASDISYASPKELLKARRAANNFLIWYGHLFRRKKGDPEIIANVSKRTDILRFFHDNVGHWNTRTTPKFIQDRFRLPRVISYSHGNVLP